MNVPAKLFSDVSFRREMRKRPPHLRVCWRLVNIEALVISQLLVSDAELPNGEPPPENAPSTLIAGLLSPFA